MRQRQRLSDNRHYLQQDDGVLVNNRLQQPLPVIDEVQHIDRIPLGMLAAVEVALPGKIIETLSNPYGIATVFDLNAEETISCQWRGR